MRGERDEGRKRDGGYGGLWLVDVWGWGVGCTRPNSAGQGELAGSDVRDNN